MYWIWKTAHVDDVTKTLWDFNFSAIFYWSSFNQIQTFCKIWPDYSISGSCFPHFGIDFWGAKSLFTGLQAIDIYTGVSYQFFLFYRSLVSAIIKPHPPAGCSFIIFSFRPFFFFGDIINMNPSFAQIQIFLFHLITQETQILPRHSFHRSFYTCWAFATALSPQSSATTLQW